MTGNFSRCDPEWISAEQRQQCSGSHSLFVQLRSPWIYNRRLCWRNYRAHCTLRQAKLTSVRSTALPMQRSARDMRLLSLSMVKLLIFTTYVRCCDESNSQILSDNLDSKPQIGHLVRSSSEIVVFLPPMLVAQEARQWCEETDIRCGEKRYQGIH